MSRGNIASITPTRFGLEVTFETSNGPWTYTYSGFAAAAILDGDDPHGYDYNSKEPGMGSAGGGLGGGLGE